MSVLTVAPELVSVAAEDLSGVGSIIGEANLLAAAPTLGVVAPAADSVSAELAVLFGGHAETYQAVSTQAQVFHQEFVTTLSSSSAAYTQAEAESASGLVRAKTLGGVGLLNSRQHQAGSSASRLWQPGISDPRPLTPPAAASQLSHPGVPRGQAYSGFAPRLFTPHNELMGAMMGGSRGIVQKIGALIRQIIENQIGYLKLVGTSLVDFVKDELSAIIGLPAAFEKAVKDLLHGNLKGAMSDVEKGFLHLFVNGTELVNRYYQNGDWWYQMGFTGALPDLWHITQIPADEMQNLANLLKPLGFGIMGNMVQHLADPLNELAFGWDYYYTGGYTPTLLLGKPLAALFDILGAPILSLEAFEDSLQSTVDALTSGHPLKAIGDLLGTPLSTLHAFLFGQGYLELGGTYNSLGAWKQGQVHLGGIFAPLEYGLSHVGYQFYPVTDPAYGTLTGGLVPALVSMLPPFLQKPLFGLGSFLDSIIAILERHPVRP